MYAQTFQLFFKPKPEPEPKAFLIKLLYFHVLFSMLLKYLALVYSHLKRVLDFLIYYPFYYLHGSQIPITGEELSICRYESTPGSEEGVDCAVCLSKIAGGEEIRVLMCDHFFHRNCLDRWVGFNFTNATCPLCRGSAGPRRAISDLGAEVISFDFCSIPNNDRDTWWLR